MKNALFYICGLLTGTAVTYFVMRKYSDQRIEEEVKAFKEEYAEKHSVIGKIIEKEGTDFGIKFSVDAKEDEIPDRIIDLNKKKKQDIMAVRDISQRMNYNAFSKPPREEDIDTGDDEDANNEEVGIVEYPREGPLDIPVTITPDQFVNECPFYDKVTLEYFDDGVLANALTEEIVEDISSTIGEDSLDKFGEFEDDVVYVRNERYRSDYEVIRQHRPFVIFSDD